jgi:Fe-S cluster assembly iron-binding protein IscA
LGLALDEPNKNETTIRVNDIDVLIEDEVKPYADASIIDYVTGVYGSGFTIDAPGRTGC